MIDNLTLRQLKEGDWLFVKHPQRKNEYGPQMIVDASRVGYIQLFAKDTNCGHWVPGGRLVTKI